jgi:DNA-binding response OmpR family regulator
VRVLVVDDEPDLRLILRLNLERWGHDVVLAANAAEADQVLSSQPVDAVLLDVSMPGESGLELLARLRAEGRAPARVALLSAALGVRGDAAALAGGVDGVLEKPFALEDLEALVAALEARPG